MARLAPGICHFTALMISVLAFCVFSVAAFAQDTGTTNWTGQWETSWRDGGGRLILSQDGNAVTGVYPLFEGRIEAVAQGRILRGRWFEDGQSGDFELVQSQDGRTFAGRFDATEWWTGVRSDQSGLVFRADQTSPSSVMRSFLAAANAAVDGDFDALRVALGMVLPTDDGQDTNARFDLTRQLFRVIDQTTLDLRDLPGAGVETDTVTATLLQSGTEEAVIITFRREDGLWFLDPAPMSVLTSQYNRLIEAREAALGATIMPSERLASPRDTMRTFLLNFAQVPDGSGPLTQSTLDLRGRPEVTRAFDGQVLAGYLKRVIDRAGYVIWQEIPDDPLSEVTYVHFRHPDGDIAIAPVQTERGVQWQFTPETLRSIRAVYTAMEDMPIAEGLSVQPEPNIHFAIRSNLRSWAPAALVPIGPFERWQWVAVFVTIGLAGAAAYLASGLLGAATSRSGRGANATPTLHATSRTVDWSVRAVTAGIIFFGASWLLGLPDRYNTIIATVATFLIVLGVFLLFWIGIGRSVEHYRRAERITGHNLILLSLTSGVMRAALLVAAILLLAHALSLPVAGVLAGFGIGGLAVALAAQPTLQNLLSGFTLFADRPVSVGDFCRFGEKMGTVEEIGLRSTRIRTLDRTVISVPNSQFLDMQLENYAGRDRFFFSTTLGLRYETTPDQLRYLLVELRKLLIAHPKVLPDPMRIRFVGLGAHSLDVEVFSYILAADMDEFAAVREDLLLRIMTTVEAAGTQFAFPSFVQYQAQDDGLEAERIQAAEKTVKDWRDARELPFPDMEWQTKSGMSGTLDYPPDGSVLQSKNSQK